MSLDTSQRFIFLWCIEKAGKLKRAKVGLPDDLSFDHLRKLAQDNFADSIGDHDYDFYYNGKQCKESADLQTIKPYHVLQLRLKIKHPQEPAANKIGLDKINQTALALRTAFFNPSFIPTIEKLGEGDKLESIFAVAYGLRNDPIGIAIIQDPAMIFHFSEAEALKRLASSRPWVVEAFDHIASTVHQEKGSGTLPRGLSNLFSPDMFGGDDDEDMEEGAGSNAGAAGVRQITREQLAAALDSLNSRASPFGGAAQRPQQSPSGPPASLANLLGLNQSSNSTTPSTTSPSASGPRAGFPAALNSLLPQASGAGPSLTPSMVARAMADAIQRLPADRRLEQYNAIRNLASQLRQQQQQRSLATSPPVVPGANHVSEPEPSAPSSSTVPAALADQYRQQLAQMRDLGITDTRLSILALRVSDGDVATAADLVLSGWNGEGADPLE